MLVRIAKYMPMPQLTIQVSVSYRTIAKSLNPVHYTPKVIGISSEYNAYFQMTNTLFVMLIISKFHPSSIRRFIETPAGKQTTADRRPVQR